MADAQDSLSQVQEKGRHDSFTIDASGRPIALGGTRLKLPTIGWVSTYEGLPHVTTKAFTISQEGSWSIGFSYEIEPEVTPCVAGLCWC